MSVRFGVFVVGLLASMASANMAKINALRCVPLALCLADEHTKSHLERAPGTTPTWRYWLAGGVIVSEAPVRAASALAFNLTICESAAEGPQPADNFPACQP